MRDDAREALVGALAIALVAGVVVFPYGRGAESGGDGGLTRLTAVFNKVDGLAVGDQIQLGGIRVGAVDSMALDDRFRAVVTLGLDPTLKLPADTSVAIHTDGLFGSKFLVLEPGGEERVLKSGDRIDYTQDALIVGNLLDLIIAQGRAKAAECVVTGANNSESGTK